VARESAQEHRRHGKFSPTLSYRKPAVGHIADAITACAESVDMQRHPSHDYGELTSKFGMMSGKSGRRVTDLASSRALAQ
jgi:hypothetical protein